MSLVGILDTIPNIFSFKSSRGDILDHFKGKEREAEREMKGEGECRKEIGEKG